MYVFGVFIPTLAREWPDATKAELGLIPSCFNGLFKPLSARDTRKPHN